MEKVIKYIFGFSVLFIALTYLVTLFKKNPGLFEQLVFELPKGVLLISLIWNLAGGILNAFVWYLINRRFCNATSFRTSYHAWAIGRIYRYVPGKMAGYIIRQKLQSGSLSDGLKASLNEALIVLIPIFITSFFYIQLYLPKRKDLLILSLAACMSIIFIRSIMVMLEKMIQPWAKAPMISKGIYSSREMVKGAINVLPAMLCHGASFYVLLRYGFKQETCHFLMVTSIFYISGVLGQLSLISPAGLGVREAFISLLMTSAGIAESVALGAALSSRVLMIISELLNAITSSLIKGVVK